MPVVLSARQKFLQIPDAIAPAPKGVFLAPGRDPCRNVARMNSCQADTLEKRGRRYGVKTQSNYQPPPLPRIHGKQSIARLGWGVGCRTDPIGPIEVVRSDDLGAARLGELNRNPDGCDRCIRF